MFRFHVHRTNDMLRFDVHRTNNVMKITFSAQLSSKIYFDDSFFY